MGAHPRALSPPCSQKECHPPSGASISPGLRLAPHCSKEADAAAYAAYKRQSIDKASGQLPHGAQVIELPHRACLSGSIRAGMAGVSTPFVAVLQNDMPVKRKFDLFALLALMETEPRVEKVHFSVGINRCHVRNSKVVCKAHRRMGRASNVSYAQEKGGGVLTRLTPVQQWFDGNHVATLTHYQRVLSIVPDGVFMEDRMFCKPWANHSLWGTFLLGAPDDGHYSGHLNGGGHRAQGCMQPPFGEGSGLVGGGGGDATVALHSLQPVYAMPVT